MGVPDPRECTDRADGDGKVRENGHNKNGVVELRAMTVSVNNLQREPGKTRKGTTAVNASKMLRRGRGGKVRIDTVAI